MKKTKNKNIFYMMCSCGNLVGSYKRHDTSVLPCPSCREQPNRYMAQHNDFPQWDITTSKWDDDGIRALILFLIAIVLISMITILVMAVLK